MQVKNINANNKIFYVNLDRNIMIIEYHLCHKNSLFFQTYLINLLDYCSDKENNYQYN